MRKDTFPDVILIDMETREELEDEKFANSVM